MKVKIVNPEGYEHGKACQLKPGSQNDNQNLFMFIDVLIV
jgi:hypothetical protein